MHLVIVVTLALFVMGVVDGAKPAFGQAATRSATAASSTEEAKVRAVIDAWYTELRAMRAKPSYSAYPWKLMAPGRIEAGPAPTELNPKSAAASPRLSNELAARALEFSFDVDRVVLDPRFAKVNVWERGYFYAFAAKETYETAAAATFVLERQPDGGWLILAHDVHSEGIPPNRITRPLPDLRELYERNPKAQR